jgi:Immunity protein 26
LLGYFFGPRRENVPELGDVEKLNPSDAVLIGMFSDLGITRSDWPRIGRLDAWNDGTWPMPTFIRYEELTGRSFRVVYDDVRPGIVIREDQLAPGEAWDGPPDGLMGAGFVELRLTRLLT